MLKLDDVCKQVSSFFRGLSKKTIGCLFGILCGAAILIFGFWKIAFLFICALIGYSIGSKSDQDESIMDSIMGFLSRHFGTL